MQFLMMVRHFGHVWALGRAILGPYRAHSQTERPQRENNR